MSEHQEAEDAPVPKVAAVPWHGGGTGSCLVFDVFSIFCEVRHESIL